jgi:hypothetical protein
MLLTEIDQLDVGVQYGVAKIATFIPAKLVKMLLAICVIT